MHANEFIKTYYQQRIPIIISICVLLADVLVYILIIYIPQGCNIGAAVFAPCPCSNYENKIELSSAVLLSITPLGINFSEVLIKFKNFHSQKCVWK